MTGPDSKGTARRRRRSGRWRRLRRAGPGDVAVWGGALTLAGLSLYLPWDAYFNAASYSPPTMQFSRDGEVPADVIALSEGRAPIFDMVAGTYVGDPPPVRLADEAAGNPFDTSPAPREDETAPALPPGVDPITTATVSGVGADPAAAAHVYTLIRAAGSAALLADRDGIYLIRPGALLPDGRRVARLAGTGAAMTIETAGGTMVRLKAPAD